MDPDTLAYLRLLELTPSLSWTAKTDQGGLTHAWYKQEGGLTMTRLVSIGLAALLLASAAFAAAEPPNAPAIQGEPQAPLSPSAYSAEVTNGR